MRGRHIPPEQSRDVLDAGDPSRLHKLRRADLRSGCTVSVGRNRALLASSRDDRVEIALDRSGRLLLDVGHSVARLLVRRHRFTSRAQSPSGARALP
jgi:hypothetical protein